MTETQPSVETVIQPAQSAEPVNQTTPETTEDTETNSSNALDMSTANGADSNATTGFDSYPPPSLPQVTATSPTDVPNPCKLFVGQVPRSMTETELRPMFVPFGEIVEITIIRDRFTQQSRGCGFVTFADPSSAAAAIAALHNKHTLPPATHPVQVKYADSDKEKTAKEHKLFVGMIPKQATEEDVRQLFSQHGSVLEVHILKSPDGTSRGCGFVKYAAQHEAVSAINSLSGYMMEVFYHTQFLWQ